MIVMNARVVGPSSAMVAQRVMMTMIDINVIAIASVKAKRMNKYPF